MTPIYPFKFLNSYTAQDRDIFFGREQEIAELYEMVFQTDLLLVYGASGTGKTSLIQCGLANKFQSHDWLPLPVRRGTDLNASLEKALVEAGDSTDSDALDFNWDEDSPKKELSPLAQKFRAIYLRHFKPVYLIFDQFEELYILGSKAEQELFIATIREILTIEQPVKVIFSIREEFLGYLYEFERKVPELLRKKLRVEPMNLEKVTRVLTGISEMKSPPSLVRLPPTERPAIAEAIFEKIRGQEKTVSIQLPYLQVFLDKLYLKSTADPDRATPTVFSMELVAAMGDMGDILRDFLEEQVVVISRELAQSEETIWKMLSPFATLEGTKEPLSPEMLALRLPDLEPELIQLAIKTFADRRILRFMEDEGFYEVAHDSLARQIHAKRSDEEIAILEIQRLIKSQAALEGEARELLSEKRLNFIEPYLPKILLSEPEQRLIDESRAAVEAELRERERLADQIRQRELAEAQAKAEADRREKEKAQAQLRRTRILLSVAVVALVLAIGAVFFAYRQTQKALEAEKNALEAEKAAKQEKDNAQKALADVLRLEIQRKKDKIERLQQTIQSLVQLGRAADAVSYQDEVQNLQAEINELQERIK